MLQQFLRRRSRRCVAHKARLQEFLELAASDGVWEVGDCVLARDVEHEVQVLLEPRLVPRLAAGGELEDRAAEAPDVGGGDDVALDLLRRHVDGRAEDALGVLDELVERAAAPKVGELDGAVVVEQDVGGLDVAVRHAVRVDVRDTLEQLPREVAQDGLGQHAALQHDGLQRARGHVLHDDAAHLLRDGVVEEDVADDVGVAERAQDLELGGDALELGRGDVGVELDLLDGDDALEVAVDEQADVDGSEAALADFGATAEIGAAVFFVEVGRTGFVFIIFLVFVVNIIFVLILLIIFVIFFLFVL